MMRKFLMIMVLFWPGQISAEILRVQAGSHPTFSRFVVYSGDANGWQLGKVQDGYELRLGNPDDTFGLENIFQLLPLGRVTEVLDRGNGSLFLRVSCTCHVDAFEIPQGIVLDIKEGRAAAGSKFEKSFEAISENDPDGNVPGQVEEKRDFTQWTSNRIVSPRTDKFWQEIGSATRYANSLNQDMDDSSESIVTSDSALTVSDSQRVQMLQQQLVEELGNAANQGFVQAELGAPVIQSQDTERVQDITEGDISNLFPEVPTTGHIRFETALDRARLGDPSVSATTDDGGYCFPDDWFDFAVWSDSGAAHAGFFIGRNSILGEFDEVNEDSVKWLVQRYLYLTFGAEAKELLSAFDVNFEQKDVILAVADIMDDGSSFSDSIPISQASCNSSVAFWSVMANKDIESDQNFNKSAILSTLSDLPIHIRIHLGPHLAQRFLSIGDEDGVKEVGNILTRAGSGIGDRHKMVVAEVDLRSDNFKSGLQHLENLVRENGSLAAEAAVRLIDEAIDRQEELPNQMPVVAAALAKESAGTNVEAELIRVQLRAEASEGSFSSAIKNTKTFLSRGKISDETATDLIREFVDGAVARNSKTEILEILSIPNLPIEKSADNVDIRLELAGAALQMGLYSRARDFVSNDHSELSPQEKVFIAEAFLREGNPTMALGAISSVSSMEADRIRASANMAIFNFQDSAILFRDLGLEKSASTAFWRQGNWNALENVTEGPIQDAIRLVSPEGDEQEGRDYDLLYSSNLIDDSAISRKILRDLLNYLERP